MSDIIKIDFKTMRENRQKKNEVSAQDFLLGKNKDKKSINYKKYRELIKDLEIKEELFLKKCQEDLLFAKISSKYIAKISSRQGSKDEDLQINTLNEFSENYGIELSSLKNNLYYPSECGEILNIKNKKHKSFDGKISGKIKGFIFAKVVYGKGGHQDNVFIEATNLCEWIKTKNKTDNIFLFLIDTDDLKKFELLKKHASKNILITSHIEFQEFIKDNYKRI